MNEDHTSIHLRVLAKRRYKCIEDSKGLKLNSSLLHNYLIDLIPWNQIDHQNQIDVGIS